MTGHPLESYQKLLQSFRVESIQKVLDSPVPPREKEIQIVGLVSGVKVIMTKKGTKMAFFQIEDLDAQIEVVVFSDLFSDQSDLVVNDRLLLVSGQVVRENGSTRILAREMSELSLAQFKEMQIQLKEISQVSRLESLSSFFEKYKGNIPVKVRIPVSVQVEGADLNQSYVVIETPYQVNTHPQLLTWIQSEFGQGSLSLIE